MMRCIQRWRIVTTPKRAANFATFPSRLIKPTNRAVVHSLQRGSGNSRGSGGYYALPAAMRIMAAHSKLACYKSRILLERMENGLSPVRAEFA